MCKRDGLACMRGLYPLRHLATEVLPTPFLSNK